jgi:hypothetical protein
MTTTCQICGRAIKANTGVIAHHGYNRPGHGWQTSSCLGARFQPYEVSRARIPEVIEIWEAMKAQREASRAALIASPPETLTRLKRAYGSRETITLTRPEGFDGARNVAAGSYRSGSYEAEHGFLAARLRDDIAGLRDALSFLRERLTAPINP